jgi:SMC interacting uncharacterized protein involved in chromosome segregation
MSALSGPALEEMKDELVEWMAETRLWLIEQLTEIYPYGAVKLSPFEQVIRWREMQGNPPAWEAMIRNFEEKYKGMPNKRARVQKDIDKFVSRMQLLEANIAQPPEEF